MTQLVTQLVICAASLSVTMPALVKVWRDYDKLPTFEEIYRLEERP